MDIIGYLEAVIDRLGAKYECSFNLELDGSARMWVKDRKTGLRYTRLWVPKELETLIEKSDIESEIEFDVTMIKSRFSDGKEEPLEQMPRHAFRVYFETYARKLDSKDFPIDETNFSYEDGALLLYKLDRSLVGMYSRETFRYIEVVEI